MVVMLAGAITNIQWLIFGYSLVFSNKGNVFLGDASHFGLSWV